jgi:uncharacterized protein involved in type VI secretion and phage assembly
MTQSTRNIDAERVTERVAEDYGGRFYGVYPALVTDLRNPEGERMTQIEVYYPWLAGGEDFRAWARYASMMAGPARGAWFLPAIGDEVLVAFEAGDPGRPYVIGALWNGADLPPQSVDPKLGPTVQSITTRSGIRITLEEVDGGGAVTIETPEGRTLRLADSSAGSAGQVTLSDALENEVSLGFDGVRVRSPMRVEVEAPQVKISASFVEVDAKVSRFSGVVECDTLISNAVVSAIYTPGEGNIW